MNRPLLARVGAAAVGLASLVVGLACAQPAASQPPDGLLAKAKEQTSLPLHVLGEAVNVDDLRVTLLSFGYGVRPLHWSGGERPADPIAKFHDAALHFLVKVRFENTSRGRYFPVDNLARLTANHHDVERIAMDDWGNAITETIWTPDGPPRTPESVFDSMNDPAAYRPGGPLSETGVLPPGSTCEVEVELQPPHFIGTSSYFLYFQPVVVSTAPLAVERIAFFVPVPQVIMPKEGQFIWNTPAFEQGLQKVYDQNHPRGNAGAKNADGAKQSAAPKPAAGSKSDSAK